MEGFGNPGRCPGLVTSGAISAENKPERALGDATLAINGFRSDAEFIWRLINIFRNFCPAGT